MSLTPSSIIGLVSWDYSRPKGGMGRSLQGIVDALRRGGFPIRVFAPYSEDRKTASFLRFTHRFGGHLLFSFLLPFVLSRRLQHDRIHHLLVPVGPGGIFLVRRPPVPTVAIVYHSYAQQAALVPGQWWKRIFQPFEARTLSFCNHIICFSEDTKRALMDAYSLTSDCITVLPHAMSIPHTMNSSRNPMLCVCIARLEARKGVDILLHAWPTILQSFPHAQLVLVGDGVQRKNIDRFIGNTHGVVRQTNLSKDVLQALLQRASIAFCPAYLEGFGLACVEAMAAGCTVIASDVDGLRQLIVPGKTGLLVPAGDSEACASAAIGVLAHPEISGQIGENAKKSIQKMCNPTAADHALCALANRLFA